MLFGMQSNARCEEAVFFPWGGSDRLRDVLLQRSRPAALPILLRYGISGRQYVLPGLSQCPPIGFLLRWRDRTQGHGGVVCRDNISHRECNGQTYTTMYVCMYGIVLVNIIYIMLDTRLHCRVRIVRCAAAKKLGAQESPAVLVRPTEYGGCSERSHCF